MYCLFSTNPLPCSKLTFSKSRLLATFNCKMVAITQILVAKNFFHSPWRPKWSQLGALRLLTEKVLQMCTIHPGIFHEEELQADSVSPRMNSIMSHDQFEPIRIRENLVVNYSDIHCLQTCLLIF